MGRYICPVCRAPRQIDLHDHLNIGTHFKILSAVSVLCSAGYLIRGLETSVKLAFSYLPIWAVCEFFHWTDQRKQTKCPQCEFDPILYHNNWRQAREQVEGKLLAIKQTADKEQEIKKRRFLGKGLAQPVANLEDKSAEIQAMNLKKIEEDAAVGRPVRLKDL